MTPAEAVATIPHRDLVVSTSALTLAVQVLCDNVAIGGQPEWEGMRKAWNLILEMQVAISAVAISAAAKAPRPVLVDESFVTPGILAELEVAK